MVRYRSSVRDILEVGNAVGLETLFHIPLPLLAPLPDIDQ